MNNPTGPEDLCRTLSEELDEIQVRLNRSAAVLDARPNEVEAERIGRYAFYLCDLYRSKVLQVPFCDESAQLAERVNILSDCALDWIDAAIDNQRTQFVP